MRSFGGAAVALLCVSAPAGAQPQPAKPADTIEVGLADSDADIVVVGMRPRGSVEGDIAPETVLDVRDIRALGASSLADVLAELGPQLRSARGRGGQPPVVLINGKRVAGFSEIRDIPPEALERVEVLPEDVALSYGFRADQRVINFVLRPRFRAITGDVEIGGPTAGGRREGELDAVLFRVREDVRMLVSGQWQQRSRLLESARTIRSTGSLASLDGTVAGTLAGGEIDPALSALAGQTVTVARVPVSAAEGVTPLAAWLDGANDLGAPDVARFRTLLPDTRDASLAISLSQPLGPRTQATLSGRLSFSRSDSLLGLAVADLQVPAGNPFSPFVGDVRLLRRVEMPGPLRRDSDSWSGRLSAQLNGDVGAWRWSLTASHDHSDNRTATERGLDLDAVSARVAAGDPQTNPFSADTLAGPMRVDRARSLGDVAILDGVVNGRLAETAAGGLSATFKAGLERRTQHSRSRRDGIARQADLDRTLARVQASFDLPLASRRRDVLAGLGDLSVNLNLSTDRLSDFDTLGSIGGGLRWRPLEAIRLDASVLVEEGAPGIQQLGNPLIATPNVRVFDFATGQTVEVTRIDGGNPALARDRRREIRLGASLQPLAGRELRLTANYVASRIRDPIAAFPEPTPEIEAAFPERFIRDAGGQLLSFDSRPVNFQSQDRQEIRWGLNLSQPLRPTAAERAAFEQRRARWQAERRQAEAEGRPPPSAPPGFGPAGGRPGGGGGGLGRDGGRGGEGPEGRVQLALFHTWKLEEQIRIGEGLPVLDLLNGSAIGSRGGVPRHEIEARAAVNKRGMGARLALNWQSATEVLSDPSGQPGPQDLLFSPLATLNLRLFMDMGQQWRLVRGNPWARGLRLSLAVDNLADSRLTVRDRAGETPLSYQPELLDPVGRRVEFSLRKIFL